ncbi:MAG: hypothetical protein JNL73_20975 [Anaerolineales bacterium]|nr:hypothetical protein [Anaerolineales bacterium]
MPNPIIPDLKTLAAAAGSTPVRLTWVDDARGRPALRIEPTKTEFAISDEWVVILSDVTLTDGVIEFDALGQSEPPQSNFLGVAFRLVDDVTHDVVYFRPFNFRAADPDRKAHAVQYVSHPQHRWWDLREQTPLKYEQPVVPAPDGDEWFHARIVVEWPEVRAYVNGATEPSLVVAALGTGEGVGVGLWVGPGRGGCFTNLTITPAVS